MGELVSGWRRLFNISLEMHSLSQSVNGFLGFVSAVNSLLGRVIAGAANGLIWREPVARSASANIPVRGASKHDVHNFSVFFDPLPPPLPSPSAIFFLRCLGYF